MQTNQIGVIADTVFLRNRMNPARSVMVLLLIGLGLTATGSQVRAEEIIDWADYPAGTQLPKATDRFYFVDGSVAVAHTVDANSTPKNPISPLKSSLYVQSDAQEQKSFRIWGKAFSDSAKRSGSYEFMFRLSEGGFTFVVGQNQKPYDPEDMSSLGFSSDQYHGVSFETGDFIDVGAVKLKTDLVGQLSADENHTFKMTWDMDSDSPGFSFFLNGERLQTVAGKDYVCPATDDQGKRGVDSFAFVTSGTGLNKYFLGNLSASASP